MIESKTSHVINSDRLGIRINLKEITKTYLDNPYCNLGGAVYIDIDLNKISFDRLSEIANQMNLEIPSKAEFTAKTPSHDLGPSASKVSSNFSKYRNETQLKTKPRMTRKLCAVESKETLSDISSHSAWSAMVKNHKTNLRASQNRNTPKGRRGRPPKKEKSKPLAVVEHSMPKNSTKMKPPKKTGKIGLIPATIPKKTLPKLPPFSDSNRPKRKAKTFAKKVINETVNDDGCFSETVLEEQNALFDKSGLIFKIFSIRIIKKSIF